MSDRLAASGIDDGILLCCLEASLVILELAQVDSEACFGFLVVERETWDVVGSAEQWVSVCTHFGVDRLSCGGE